MEILAGTVFKASRKKNTWKVLLLGLNLWSQQISMALVLYGFLSRWDFHSGVHWWCWISFPLSHQNAAFTWRVIPKLQQQRWSSSITEITSSTGSSLCHSRCTKPKPAVYYPVQSSCPTLPCYQNFPYNTHSFMKPGNTTHPWHHFLVLVKLSITSGFHPDFQMLW